MSLSRWITPLTAVVLTAGALAWAAQPERPKPGAMDMDSFGRLPVQDGGRVKPLDTMARVALTIINNRQTASDADGRKLSPVRWLLDTMTLETRDLDAPAAKARIFRIDNVQVVDALKLEHRPGSWRYSLAELAPRFDEIQRLVEPVEEIEAKKRTLVQAKLLEVHRHLGEWLRLHQWRLAVLPPEPGSPTGEEWSTIAAWHPDQLGRSAARNLEDRGEFDRKKDIDDTVRQRFRAELDRLRVSAPTDARAFVAILDAYRAGDAARFNEAVANFRQLTADRLPPAATTRLNVELAYNRIAPFYFCMVGYVLSFAAVCLGWALSTGRATAAQAVFRFATALTLSILCVHTATHFARMYVMDRPLVFVTNLYSSAVFIGWCAVAVGLIVERVHGRGIGTALACGAGASSLLVAYYIDLGMEGDKFEMMQAVLDTNFWLATHVTTVTFGYAATFVAGLVGIAYILLGVFTPLLDRSLTKTLSGLIYGIVCFATLLSFTGTVLGGIWADYSWGRFWGWDPKENGAMLIVLWNALILHARWAGLVKQRGLANLAVFGNIVTAWSWFGTNQLGIGLHSYGFTSAAALALVVFNGAMLGVIALGLIPERLWASRQPAAAY